MLPIVLEQIVQSVKSTPFVWVRDTPTNDELAYLKTQAFDKSPFDPLFLRKQTFLDLESGKARLVCRRGPFARVLAIVYPETKLPWNLYSRIFSAFGPPQKSCVKEGARVWTVFIFANPTERMFPIETSNTLSVGPAHINGGYAFPNNSKSIVIYREEESERVLVHELLHACGSDSFSNSVEIREALTETWAELFLIGILAKGSLQKAKKLWDIQSQWISDQNFKLHLVYNVKEIQDYPWRYTVARKQCLEQFGISLPSPNPSSSTSLRFTSPMLLM
jgi:hypothetical protein